MNGVCCGWAAISRGQQPFLPPSQLFWAVLVVVTMDNSASHTNWALISQAAQGNVWPGRQAVEQLLKRYWPAIYAFIRGSGRDVDDAADLTQGFICDVVLGRRLFAQADQSRGRFRHLLRTAVGNYLIEVHRQETRRKRQPGGRRVPLNMESAEAPSVRTSPESAFDQQWNATLIRRVLDQVRTECVRTGLETHWAVFEARIARPMLCNERPVAYARLVERLSLSDEAQASNMTVVVRRRFVQGLMQEVERTVSHQDEVEGELRDLLQAMEVRP